MLHNKVPTLQRQDPTWGAHSAPSDL